MTDRTPATTQTLLVRGGEATQADADALGRIQAYARGTLPRIQAQADKWIGGLTALTGLLSIAIVVKGPESFSKLVSKRELLWFTIEPDTFVIGAMCLGGLLIGVGIFCAYAAAHGNPFDDELDGIAWDAQSLPVAGLDAKWRGAVRNTAKTAQKSLRNAVVSSIVGVLALGLAVLITWTTEEAPSKDTNEACVSMGDSILKFTELPAVVEGSVQLSILACPEPGG